MGVVPPKPPYMPPIPRQLDLHIHAHGEAWARFEAEREWSAFERGEIYRRSEPAHFLFSGGKIIPKRRGA